MLSFHQVYVNLNMKLLFLISLLISPHCQCMQLSFMQGQNASLKFPYPCDITEVTLRYAYRQPFYRSTDGSLSLLHQDQAQRFRVQNRVNNCFLSLTIHNVMKKDEGTYILSVFKDGQLLVDNTHRIWIGVDYPPGKASCVEREDKGGGWVSLECTASAGSIPGRIECYQNGQWMPPMTDPMEADTTLEQTILIRKSQPVFCCSSPSGESKDMCQCSDSALYLTEESSIHPCPIITPTSMSMDNIQESKQTPSSQSYYTSSMISTTSNEGKVVCFTSIYMIIYNIFCVFIIILLITDITARVTINFKQRKKSCSSEKNNDKGSASV